MKLKPLPQNYTHSEAEKRWQRHWVAAKTYAWNNDSPRDKTYVIDTPPPTVSGLLHMGHVFSYTQCDFVARYQRMKGMDVFYPMGFDDNGLPTERLVEKAKKIRAVDMSREDFIAECMSVSEEARGEFRELFQSIALSVDWAQEYHTISESSRRISQESFLDLYEKGHVERQLKPFFWDPVDQTAIAQAEIEDKELDSSWNDIWFGVEPEPSPSGRGQGEGYYDYQPKTLIENARKLRENQTDAEKLLWSILRDQQLGVKFRRQHPLDHYVLDFYCHEIKLAIELDGGQHNEPETQDKDNQRSEYLQAKGIKVLRFWNHDTLHNIEGVVESILQALTPALSQRERENRILIGTTRPELIPACVGIFYHPDDARYAHLAGKHAITPLFGVKVPILTDDTVDPEKGTGIMMCCTFGDEADIEKWKKHKLETRVVLNKYGKLEFGVQSAEYSEEKNSELRTLNSELYATLQGLKVNAARAKIIELLRESGDLKESKPIRHTVKCAERSGAPLEILPTHQWFVKVCDKKEALKKRANECNWNPDWMKLRMEQWIDGLNSDWCISRQRYFGVPFPVWYVHEKIGERTGLVTHAAGDGTIKSQQKVPFEDFKLVDMIIAEKHELPINPISTPPSDIVDIISQEYPGSWRAKSKETGKELWIVADFDVMDTWATSSISPQISAGGIHGHPAGRKAPAQDLLQQKDSAQSLRDSQNDGARFSKLFPADLRPQAHEIIRTWAFYTVVKSHLHSDSIPWKNLMISGWCLAEDKTKMSKSKGNVVTPVELIEEQGTDAVRYWAATSRLGADTAFSKDLLKIGKKLVNKLWNATKFAAIHLEKLDGAPPAAAHDGVITAPLDIWILTRLHRAIEKSTAAFESYEYADGLRAAEDFFWNDFCDNYLELVKTRVYDEAGQNPAAQASAVHTIYHALQGILKLFAPFVPHITEELYSHLFVDEYARTGSLHARGQWPIASDYPQDANAEAQGIAAVSILNAIRKAKSERGVSIKYPIEMMVLHSAYDGAEALKENDMNAILEDVKAAGNVAELIWSNELPEASTHTDCGRFALALRFAAQADVA